MGHRLGDYDLWYLPCSKCGYRIGKSSERSKKACWKCGNIHIQRDFSDNALKEKCSVTGINK